MEPDALAIPVTGSGWRYVLSVRPAKEVANELSGTPVYGYRSMERRLECPGSSLSAGRFARSAQDAEDTPMVSSKRPSKAGQPTKKRAGPISLHGLDFDDVMRRMVRAPKQPKKRVAPKDK